MTKEQFIDKLQEYTMLRTIKYWMVGKWFQLLELLGLRVTLDWVMLRVLCKELGEDKAQEIFCMAILLHGDLPWVWQREKLRTKTPFDS